MITKTTHLFMAACLLLLFSIQSEASNGYAPHGIGIKAKGMGGTGVAEAKDTVGAGMNPATMAKLGNRVDFGVDIFKPDRTATIHNNGLNANPGTYNDSHDDIFFIPEFGYNRQATDKVTIGLVVYGNGGMNTSYTSPVYSSSNPAQKVDTGINLQQVFISPTITYKLNEKNSVGLSVNLAYQRFKAYGLADYAPYVAGASTQFLTDAGSDNSYGAGLRLGWAGNVSDTLTIGATYMPRTDMSNFDKYKTLFAEDGDFDIPTNYAVGLSYRPTKNLRAAFDVMRIHYSEVASIGNPNTPQQGSLGTNNGRGFGWQDQTIYKIGLSYQTRPDLTLRIGYNHGDMPIGSDDTSINVLAPAVVEDHLTLGFTWIIADTTELSISYMHGFRETLIGTNDAPGYGGGADISMSQNSLGLAYGWKF